MKALAGVSIPDQFASEFVRLLHRFDEAHAGCTIMLIADAELPVSADQFRTTCARHSPGLPAIDPRRFDRDSD